jgi:hypothetical protein
MMYQSISFACILCFFTYLASFAQELPQASPIAKIEQRIGLTDVTIRYSRPSVKDRKIWGDLVPYRTFSVLVPMPVRLLAFRIM